MWAASGAADTAPLSWEVWAYLAFHHERRPVPGAGAMPADALRDDAPPLLPPWAFRPDAWVFTDTLVRLPGAREPWLRAIYDRLKDRPYGHPFW